MKKNQCKKAVFVLLLGVGFVIGCSQGHTDTEKKQEFYRKNDAARIAKIDECKKMPKEEMEKDASCRAALGAGNPFQEKKGGGPGFVDFK